ncbi:hypothetical protein [Xanthobacter aminoxidans]
MDELDTLITGLWKLCAIALLTAAAGIFIVAALGIWTAVAEIAGPMVLP